MVIIIPLLYKSPNLFLHYYEIMVNYEIILHHSRVFTNDSLICYFFRSHIKRSRFIWFCYITGLFFYELYRCVLLIRFFILYFYVLLTLLFNTWNTDWFNTERSIRFYFIVSRYNRSFRLWFVIFAYFWAELDFIFFFFWFWWFYCRVWIVYSKASTDLRDTYTYFFFIFSIYL